MTGTDDRTNRSRELDFKRGLSELMKAHGVGCIKVETETHWGELRDARIEVEVNSQDGIYSFSINLGSYFTVDDLH
jgi:hypothetical protein